MTTPLRLRPSVCYAEAIQFAEDGSNWRDFQGWLGWDILEESKVWWPTPDPATLRSLYFVSVDRDGVEIEFTLEPGDWLVITDGGVRVKYPDGVFQMMYEEFS